MNLRPFAPILPLLVLTLSMARSRAQAPPLSQQPILKSALDFLQKTEPETLDQQAHICAIPAPPFEESIRADYFRKQFIELGLKDVHIDAVGRRPTGRVPEDAPILAAVRRANEALGIPSRFEPMSTDSNIPISLGIPAVTLCSGGDATGSHSLAERFDSKDSHLGAQRALLVLLELARVAP